MSSASRASAHPFDRLVKALTSTISLKIVMMVTGILGAGFVLGHMLGNLQVFLGRDVYNHYAAVMQGLGGLLWIVRGGLLTILVLHVAASVALFRRNTGARPDRYANLKQRVTNPAALYMMELGIVVLLFLAYHLAHFTLGWVSTEFGGINYADLRQATDAGEQRDLYSHFIISFQQPRIAILYIVGNLALAAHLAHGVSSAFKTAGIAIGRWRPPFEVLGPAFGLIIGLGNISMPLAVWAGFISM